MAGSEHIASSTELISEIFRCNAELAGQILRAGINRDFGASSIIIRQGDLVSHVYLVLQGMAQSVIYTGNGAVVFIEDYNRGDIFGALDLSQSMPHEAEVIAVIDLSSLQFESHALAGLGERYACIGMALSRMLMARLRRTTTRIYERTALGAAGRVYAELLRMGEASDHVISPTPVVSDLAMRVGTTRETASRCLGTLLRRGIIQRDDAALTIIAPGRLADLVF